MKRVTSSSHEAFREELPALLYSSSVPRRTESPGQQHGAFCFLLKNRTISLSARVICSAEAALGRLMESRRGVSRPLELPPGCSLRLHLNQVIFTHLIQSHQTTLGRRSEKEVWKRSNSHLHTSDQFCIILKESPAGLEFLCPPQEFLSSNTKYGAGRKDMLQSPSRSYNQPWFLWWKHTAEAP